MKMTSRFAMVAAAGVLLGAAVTSAKAADLGGGCCADLEERVAELEATTARKGNRVVSLQVYGQVNKALLFWDDGTDSDTYIVDHDSSGSRVGFIGKAALKPGWTAGFNLEFDVQDSASNRVSNGDDEGATSLGVTGESEIRTRLSNLYVESERFGRITLGQQASAADGAAEVVLGNSLSNASVFVGNNFGIGGNKLSGSTLPKSDGSKFTSGYASSFDGDREDVIRYDTPSIYGFILSASWGDNDYYDAALRFKKEWNSIRIAAAVSYQNFQAESGSFGASTTTTATTTEDDDDVYTTKLKTENNGINPEEFEIINGSISVMHVPTGIYGAFAAGSREIDGNDAGEFWYAQLGIEKKFLSYGSTTVYGEYGLYSDQLVSGGTPPDPTALTSGIESEAERWGFGVVQKFDSAAMELYAQATFWSFEDSAKREDDIEDFSTIMVGSRIKF